MAFGQPSGPPASAKQLRDLLSLLQDAGHVDFRDARGPMGFTQRQAAGKFTRDEADVFIQQLEGQADGDLEPASGRLATKISGVERLLANYTSEQLAAELQRRGWVVMEP